MSRTMTSIIIGVVLIYAGLCAALFFFQRNLIYFPQPRTPGEGTTTFTLSTADAEVLVTVRQRSSANAVLYFGGNAEDASGSLPDLATAFPDHSIYLLHYRGYGGSSGKPSEAALVADALTLFDKIHLEKKHVIAVGRSLGSGVAIQLASQRAVSRLILVTPYNSLQELAVRLYPYFPIRWLLLDKFESWRHAEQVAIPTLIIAAEHDEVIPRASTDALYKHFHNGIAVLKVLPETEHNTLSNHPEYIQLLKSVLLQSSGSLKQATSTPSS